jgi:FkbM family methyltransferase
MPDIWLLGLARISRRLWRIKGFDRLLRILYTTKRRGTGRDSFQAVIPYDRNLLIHVDTSSFFEWTVFFKGYYEPDIVQVHKLILRPSMVAVDVGANVGLHTLIMSELVGDEGHVFAIEPTPEFADRLLRNCLLNRRRNVTLLRLACSRPGLQSGTLVVSSTSVRTAALQPTDSTPFSEEVERLNVDLKTLDEVVIMNALNRLDFIKIDVDGGEYDVLLGAETTLARYHPHVLFEYSPNYSKFGADADKVHTFLRDVGYSLYAVNSSRGLFSYLSLVERGGLPAFGNLLAVSDRVNV